MTRIAVIGAGSLGFTRNILRDILTFESLRDCTFALMDIDKERLEFAERAARSIIDRASCSAGVEATMDRKQALKDADIVVTTILVNSVDIWRHDIEIPKKYGVDINIGDTRGPAGI